MFPSIGRPFLALILPVTLSASALAEPAPTIHLIGDSTMSNYSLTASPQRGWGQFVDEIFVDDVAVENYAAGGRSTKSFQTENRWEPVVEKLKAGDWVIIQFGHNDQKKDKPDLYAPYDTDYKANLTKFVKDTRAKGANPIIATSIYRMFYDAEGKLKSTLGKYPQAAREVAQELKVPLIDLEAMTKEDLSKWGEEGAKPYYLFFEPGEMAAWPEGKADRTHLSEKGGKWIADLFAKGLRASECPLMKYLKPEAGVAAP